MTTTEKSLLGHKKYPFFWMSVFSLVASIALARLNVYLGTQVNYLDYLSLFNALTIAMLLCGGIAIVMSVAGLWRARFRSIPLALMSLISSAFLILLFLID